MQVNARSDEALHEGHEGGTKNTKKARNHFPRTAMDFRKGVESRCRFGCDWRDRLPIC
jgi:hypothetical protein